MSTGNLADVKKPVIHQVDPDGMIVNISRTSTIDETALIAARSDGRLGSAALDDFEGESVLDPRLPDRPNLLLQPRHASGTIETRQAISRLLRDNLTAHLAGQPLLRPILRGST